MTYTVQSSFDNGGFGKRWGCYFDGPINCCEHARGRIATRKETSEIIGEAFRTLSCSMSNYKHDKYVRPRLKPPEGWDSKANPEWHYLVEDFPVYWRIVCSAMDINPDPRRFKIAIMNHQFGGNHYCIMADGDVLINPDPSLHGPIEKLLELPL